MKRRVNHWVKSCAFQLNGMPTRTHLNVLPLGAYKILLGMDLMFIHMTKVDYYAKAIEFIDDDGENIILEVKKNPT